MSENGRWQVGFWIMTVVFFSWCGTLTANIINNDRIREAADSSILATVNTHYQEIIQRLTRMEAKK